MLLKVIAQVHSLTSPFTPYPSRAKRNELLLSDSRHVDPPSTLTDRQLFVERFPSKDRTGEGIDTLIIALIATPDFYVIRVSTLTI